MGFTFKKLDIPEVILVEAKSFLDDRGFFMESFRESIFINNGIDAKFGKYFLCLSTSPSSVKKLLTCNICENASESCFRRCSEQFKLSNKVPQHSYRHRNSLYIQRITVLQSFRKNLNKIFFSQGITFYQCKVCLQ